MTVLFEWFSLVFGKYKYIYTSMSTRCHISRYNKNLIFYTCVKYFLTHYTLINKFEKEINSII